MARTRHGVTVLEVAAHPFRRPAVVGAGALLLTRAGFVLPTAGKGQKAAKWKIHRCACVRQAQARWAQEKEREPDSIPCRTRSSWARPGALWSSRIQCIPRSPQNTPDDGGYRSRDNRAAPRRPTRLPSGNRGRPDSLTLPFRIAKCVSADLDGIAALQNLDPRGLPGNVSRAESSELHARAGNFDDSVFGEDVWVLK